MPGQLLHPDLSPTYLGALVLPVLETLALTLAAMTLAFVGGIGIALLGVLGGGAGRIVARVLTIFRALPELTLAILCVVFFGLGSGAALVALGAYYAASTGKVFTELLEAAPPRPLAGLRRSGAGPIALACYGYLPLSAPQLLAYGSFAFECALRAGVVVGAVGGGGIGGELVGSLAAFDLARAATCILLTIALIALLDQASHWLRAHPRGLWPLLAAGLGSVAWLWPDMVSPGHGARVLAEMVPPLLRPEDWAALPRLLGETLAMALGATLLAALLALPLALAASRTTAPRWLAAPCRILASALRAMPELIWALVLLLWLGIGPLAGGAALLLHSLGSFIRLFADSLDAAPSPPRAGVLRAGGSGAVATLYAALPQAARAIATHVAFRFEWNLRMATVLGLIGAGGIGQALYEAQQLMFYDRLAGWLIVTAILLLSAEWLARRLRLHPLPFSSSRIPENWERS